MTPPITRTPITTPIVAHAVLGKFRMPSLKTLLKKGVRVPLTCAGTCKTKLELVLARKTAKKLHLSTVVASKTFTFKGRRTIVLKPSRKAAKKLRGLRRATFSVKRVS